MPFEEGDSDMPLYDSASRPEYSSNHTIVDFGMTIINPNLGNGTSSFNPVTSSGGYTEERNWVVVGVLIALIIMLWLILGGMLCYPIMRFIRRKMPVSKRRINRRYETIEGWLITKVVRPHDESCNQMQKKAQQPQAVTAPTSTTCSASDVESQTTTSNAGGNMKHAESYDTGELTTAVSDNFCLFDYDDDDRDCPICMEPFAVGDIVSWSSYDRCTHVYHHQCIKEWLLRHNNCPFCREIFLPVDRANTKITMKVFRELSDLRARRAEKTYYCVQDGLVTLDKEKPATTSICSGGHNNHRTNPTTAATSPSILLRKCGHIKAADIKERLKPGVTKAELKKLRGDRAEKICYGDTEEGHLNVIIQDYDIDQDIEAQHQQRQSTAQQTTILVPDSPNSEPTIVRNDSLTTESSDEEEEEEDKLEEEDENDSIVEAGMTAAGCQCATSLVVEEALAAIGVTKEEDDEPAAKDVTVSDAEGTASTFSLVEEEKSTETAPTHDFAESQSDAPIELELHEEPDTSCSSAASEEAETEPAPPAETED